MTATITRPVPNPKLADLLDSLKKDIFLSLNCHALATIQSFDPVEQTVSATINYTRTQIRANQDGTYSNQEINYSIIVDAPVIALGGGKSALTFPIVQGDQALIFFNDRDIDNWVAGGRTSNVGPVATPRLHSFSDAIALVGLNKISGYDPDRAVLRNGDGPAMVAIGPELIEISNEVTSLFDILDETLTALIALITVMATTPPVTAWETAVVAAAATAETALTTVQLLLPELLE